MKRHQLLAMVGFTLTAALAVVGCSSGSKGSSDSSASSDGELVTVTLRHSWVPDQITLPFAAAKVEGFYEEEGIRLIDQAGNGGAVGVQLVAAGEVNFATGEASHVISARSRGINVISVMQEYENQPGAVITMEDSGLDTWESLIGKSVGGTAASSGHVGFEAALELQGISKDAVTFVNMSPGAQFAAMSSGEIDAALTFLGNLAGIPELNGHVNIMTFADAGYLAPSTCLFADEKWVSENEDLVKRFVRASIKGIKFTVENPRQAAEDMASITGGVTADNLEATWLLDQQFIATDFTATNGLGYHPADQWTFLKDALLSNGEIEEDTDASKAWTNKYIDQVFEESPDVKTYTDPTK
jgi:NitT/TauT family transport system substrate-binding protein